MMILTEEKAEELLRPYKSDGWTDMFAGLKRTTSSEIANVTASGKLTEEDVFG